MSQGNDKPSDVIIYWWSQNDVLFIVYWFISLHCQYWLLVLNCLCRLCQAQFFLFNFLSLSDWMMESHRVVLTFESVDETLSCDRSNESYWAVLSCGTVFIMLYKVVLTFESVDEILSCDHSNESSLPVFSHGTNCFSTFHKMKFGNFVEIWFWPL